MIAIPRPGGRREVRRYTVPGRADRCGSRRPVAAGRYVRLRAARALVGLAMSLMRMAALAYRAGYLAPAQIEHCVGVSAKLRGRACHLIGTMARNAPSRSGSGATASQPATALTRAVTSLSHLSSHCRIRPFGP
jgi:hypothetical protein